MARNIYAKADLQNGLAKAEVESLKKEILDNRKNLTSAALDKALRGKISKHVGITTQEAALLPKKNRYLFRSQAGIEAVLKQVFPASNDSYIYEFIAKKCYELDEDEEFEAEAVLPVPFCATLKKGRWYASKAARVIMCPMPWGVRNKTGLPFRVIGIVPSMEADDLETFSEEVFYEGHRIPVRTIHQA